MLGAASLNSDEVGMVGIGAIVAVVLVGTVLSVIISAVIGRVVVLIVMVVLGALIWQQRAAIEAKVKKCQSDMTFMGIHVHAPADVQAQCKSVTR